MTNSPKKPDPANQIELRLKELIDLIVPLHALLEGSYDETTGRLEEVIEALAEIAYSLQKTVKTMNKERDSLSPALETRFKTIEIVQERQIQLLTDLHDWLGAPQRQTAEQAS